MKMEWMRELYKMKKTTLETRVGHATTSFLQEETRQYIEKHTINGKYTGEPKYLQIYTQLEAYNKN